MLNATLNPARPVVSVCQPCNCHTNHSRQMSGISSCCKWTSNTYGYTCCRHFLFVDML